MQGSQSYTLTILDLFVLTRGAICGAEAVVAIFDGDTEIDRMSFKGKVGSGGDGYCRTFVAKPGLTAKIISGPGSITLSSVLI